MAKNRPPFCQPPVQHSIEICSWCWGRAGGGSGSGGDPRVTHAGASHPGFKLQPHCCHLLSETLSKWPELTIGRGLTQLLRQVAGRFWKMGAWEWVPRCARVRAQV